MCDRKSLCNDSIIQKPSDFPGFTMKGKEFWRMLIKVACKKVLLYNGNVEKRKNEKRMKNEQIISGSASL